MRVLRCCECVCFNLRCRLLVYSAVFGVNRAQVILSGCEIVMVGPGKYFMLFIGVVGWA